MNLDNLGPAEVQNMKERCKEYEEQLKHRYYKFKCSIRTSQSPNKTDDEEPARPMRYQRISQLMNCYDDDEYHCLFQRQQDQFKCYQNLDRTTSQLMKKEKQLLLKNVLHSKVKRVKKTSVDEDQSEEALQEPEDIAVKPLVYQQVKQDFQNSLIEHYTENKKIYPTFSVLNPMLLNTIRLSKRKKYI